MIYFVDVQGTLISDIDKSLLNGAKDLIDYFNEKDLPYVVITNNTKAKSQKFLNNLQSKGLNIKQNSYLDPFCVLNEILPVCEVALFGAPEFINTMQELGYKQNLINPKAVIIASFDDFTFMDFAKMIELIQNGAKLIAMHATSTYKKNAVLYPGVGAIASMLKYATNVQAQVVGKPSELFYTTALNYAKNQNKNIDFSDVCIISDDAKGDLLGAKKLGMKTILVLSGKISNPNQINIDKNNIDGIFNDVGEFLINLKNS